MTTCFAHRSGPSGSSLVIGNTLIERHFDLASPRGPLTTALIDKQTGGNFTWRYPSNAPDIDLPGEAAAAPADLPSIQSDWIADDPIAPPHLRVTLDWQLGSLQLRRVFRIYDDVPAIAADLYLRGRAASPAWRHAASTTAAPIEDPDKLHRADFRAPSMDHLHWSHPHISLEAVQFFDRTDQRNTLVRTHRSMPYNTPSLLTGNILLGRDLLHNRGFALLKEAPCSDTQLSNPGSDFFITSTGIHCIGIGIDPSDLHGTEWRRAYGCVIALASATDDACSDLTDALRRYQHQLRPHQNSRDFQLMINTWGDRNRDARMCESFVLQELDAAAKLGVTHLQLDDGWQTGTSPNSATAAPGTPGSPRSPATHDTLGLATDFWLPHPTRFPRGLQPILDKARSLDIQIGLWFAPFRGKDNDYANWRRDADTLISLHRQFGIRVFKIDMVNIATQTAESNLRHMFDAIVAATQGDVCFNLDTTAQRRYGYHHFREFGHTFVENRYTDWSNYYPHRTLRNLWSLARWMPPQYLQLEFLNKWRNADKYGDDPLAPANIPFAYCFAVTMMSQPLAWFEASGLPPEAFGIAPLIRTYREHQPAIHAGRIYPLGDEPNGTTWTGFQSITSPTTGYLLIFREKNDVPTKSLRLWPTPHRRLTATALAGNAADFTTAIPSDGKVAFALPHPFTFALWHYELQ